MAAISFDSSVVQSYMVCSAILALKLLAVGSLTGMRRMWSGSYANPEDAKGFKGKVKLDDPLVERTKRAHLNDLENIPAFWLLGALYLTTAPAAMWAILLFRVYTAARIIHTIVYAVVPLPQPTRAMAYIIPYGIKIYMGLQVMMYYITALLLPLLSDPVLKLYPLGIKEIPQSSIIGTYAAILTFIELLQAFREYHLVKQT